MVDEASIFEQLPRRKSRTIPLRDEFPVHDEVVQRFTPGRKSRAMPLREAAPVHDEIVQSFFGLGRVKSADKQDEAQQPQEQEQLEGDLEDQRRQEAYREK